MNYFHDIYGNDEQKALFASLIRQGRLSHCYIFEAPRGGGKKMTALRLAAALAYKAEPSDEGIAKCRRILEGSSPDVKILSRAADKKSIGVDAAREFVASVYLTPAELNFKMYIFDEADLLTPQAQNALLKVIEEPPQNVYLILLCENSLSLLATVRSRAQRVVLERFSETALASFAEKDGGAIDGERLSFAVRIANGAIGRLREVLENGDGEFSAYQMAKKTVSLQAERASGKGGGYYAFLQSVSEFASAREAFDSYTAFLLTAYGDIVGVAREKQTAPVFFTGEEAERLSGLLSLSAVTKSFEAVSILRNDMKFHVNLSLAAAKLCMALWAAV